MRIRERGPERGKRGAGTESSAARHDFGETNRLRPSWRRIVSRLGMPVSESSNKPIGDENPITNFVRFGAHEAIGARPKEDVLPAKEYREQQHVGREFVTGGLSAEKAARILWTDAQWLHQNADSSYMGLQYASVVPNDIRMIIAGAADNEHHPSQEMLRRTILAMSTINLKQRLRDAEVADVNVDEVEASLMRDLDNLRDGTQPTLDDRALTILDELIARIDDSLKRTHHSQFDAEAQTLMSQTRTLAAEVSIELLAVYPAEVLAGSHGLAVQLAGTAVSASILVFAAGVRHGGTALWRQPDLAPHLTRGFQLITKQATVLQYDLKAFGRDLLELNAHIETIKGKAIAIQYGMYGIITLIEVADGWDGADHVAAGELVIRSCSDVVSYCDDGSVCLEQHAAVSATQLGEWVKTPWAVLVPAPLALREDARLSLVTRIAESLGTGNFKRWSKATLD
jgi:hypothetical protein